MEVKKIKLPFKIREPILAIGAQTKNTVCFAKGTFAYLSPIHPDLNNPKDFLTFQKVVKYFFKERPKIIAHDLHPEYQSTKYALSVAGNYALVATQHHHSHIASCMVENGLENQKVIGVAFDGTGLGTDNTIWGAEFLICDYKSFKRKTGLRKVPLLGGERAIIEPWRLSAIWLYSIYKDRFWDLGLRLMKKTQRKKWQVLKKMYLSGVNAPLASSMGRLFDAAASLILEREKVNFEAELAIKLEEVATRYRLQATGYNFKITNSKDGYVIDPQPVFKQIVSDLKAGEPKENIAYRFHLTVAEMIKRVCLLLRRQSSVNKIVLSGGVFQNNLLLGLSLDLLYKEGFEVFSYNRLSGNDSSISLGQVAIANYQ